MRLTAIGLAAAVLLGATSVSAPPAAAQSIEVGPGGGIGVDLRSNRQRERDFQREEARRDRDIERRRADRRDRDYGDVTTSSTRRGCREVTVRERNAYGEVETRRTRDCR